VVKGKMSYLSPEAARGEEVDHRADIFAVGILLYELLTGKRLFYGETDYQTVELVRNAKIPPIKPQNPQVEPELEDIVRKALAKRKEDRYQNATDIQDALAQYAYSRGLEGDRARHRRAGAPVPRDKRMQSGEGKPKTSIIDHLLQDEIAKFTSVDDDGTGRRRPAAVGRRAGTARRTGRAAPVGRRLRRPARVGRGTSDAGAGHRRGRRDGSAQDEPRHAAHHEGAGAGRAPRGRRRVPSPPPMRPPDPMDQTPGPETLASVLEPTPGPEALPPEALSRELEPADPRGRSPSAPIAPKKGRSFMIGAMIGVVALVAFLAYLKKTAPTAPPPPPAAAAAPTPAP
jgi:serine/threonine-protein kinase